VKQGQQRFWGRAGADGIPLGRGVSQAVSACMQQDLRSIDLQGLSPLEARDHVGVLLRLDEASRSVGQADDEVRIVQPARIAPPESDRPGFPRRIAVPPSDLSCQRGAQIGTLRRTKRERTYPSSTGNSGLTRGLQPGKPAPLSGRVERRTNGGENALTGQSLRGRFLLGGGLRDTSGAKPTLVVSLCLPPAAPAPTLSPMKKIPIGRSKPPAAKAATTPASKPLVAVPRAAQKPVNATCSAISRAVRSVAARRRRATA